LLQKDFINLRTSFVFILSNSKAKELEFEEEFKMPEFAELANPETWIHVPAMILK